MSPGIYFPDVTASTRSLPVTMSPVCNWINDVELAENHRFIRGHTVAVSIVRFWSICMVHVKSIQSYISDKHEALSVRQCVASEDAASTVEVGEWVNGINMWT